MESEDQQLVQLVRDLPADQLSRDQIERLWERFVESASLRNDLIAETPGADYLREVFGRLDLPVDKYLFDSPPAGPAATLGQNTVGEKTPRRNQRFLWIFLAVLVLANLAGLVLAVLLPLWSPNQPSTGDERPRSAAESDAARQPQEDVDRSLSDAATTADSPLSDIASAEDGGSETPVETGPSPARIPADDASDDRASSDVALDTAGASANGTSPPPPDDEPAIAESDEGAPVSDDVDVAIADDLSHPLQIELNKEGYNVWAELKAALDDRAFSDVLRMVRLTPTDTQLGLLPDPSDEDLFVPFNSLIAVAMRDHPELLDAMRTKFGTVAQLRLSAAIAESDAAGVESVAVQFYGTEAAAEAHRWLGDRALSGGLFRAAEGHYRRALAFGFTPFRADLNARLRLAGAMLGLDLGEPVTLPIDLDDMQMSASEFEALVEQQRGRHVDSATTSPVASDPSGDVPFAPAPGKYQLRRWSSMTIGPRGWVMIDGPRWQHTPVPDWPAWCLSAATAKRLAVVSNRQQISAIDLVTGRHMWDEEFGESRGSPPTWSWVPMRPLVVGDRIFARRLPRVTGPELVCLDRETGRILWASRPGDHVASDPFWHRGTLVAITTDSTKPTFPSQPRRPLRTARERVFHLQLTTFEPDTGQVLDQRPLIRLRDRWYGILPCRAARAGDGLVVTVGGTTLRVSFDGDIRWVRRQPLASKAGDVPHKDRYFSPPLVVGSRVVTHQPGGAPIECLDLASGRRIWQSELKNAARMIGVVNQRLVIRSDSKLLALDIDTGEETWQHEPKGLTQAYSCGGPGGLAYVDYTIFPSGSWQLDLVWLNPDTGEVARRQELLEIHRGRLDLPQCGPFFRIGDRLFVAVFEDQRNLRNRDVFELVPGR